jgi:hypothetical protein
MMLTCLQDRADLPCVSCDSAGGDVAHRAPAPAARRGNSTTRDNRVYRA